MRRLAAGGILLLPLLLSGCRDLLPLSASYHDIENIELVRTVCVDGTDTGLSVTACGEIREDGTGEIWQQDGESFETVIQELKNHPGKELLFSHADYLVVGENMDGEKIGELLEYIAASPEFRLGCRLFSYGGGNAGQLAQSMKNQQANITVQLERTGEERVCSCGECITSLLEKNCGKLLRLAATENPASDEKIIIEEKGYDILWREGGNTDGAG